MPPPPNLHVAGIVAANSPSYLESLFALLEEGACVVPLRSKEDAERLDLTRVKTVQTPVRGFGWLDPPRMPPKGSAEPAMIAFTSGTEGRPKGVVLTHGALGDVVNRLNARMGLDASVREYVGIPVYYSFGFGRCRAVGATGGRLYLPENGFDPVEVAEMLRKGEINALSAVPSLLRSLFDARDLFVDAGSGLRWLEIGSQYMSREEKVAVRTLFPKARIVQHYGLTEASRATLLSIDTAPESLLESVGEATSASEVAISGDGHILLRGPHVASGVLTPDGLVDPRDASGWLRTNDLGRLEGGHLFYEGRADDVINCGGIKLAPESIERALAAKLGLDGSFAVGRTPDPVRGDGILLACTGPATSRHLELVAALEAETARLGVNARGSLRVVELDALPRTETGKVQRNRLTELAGRELVLEPAVVDAPKEAHHTESEAKLIEIWRSALGTKRVDIDESFYDLGGDSVTALGVVVRMSRAGIDLAVCRRIFQGATIRQLASSVGGDTGEVGSPVISTGSGQRQYINTLMVNVLRGLLVASVVLGHWSTGFFERVPALGAFAPWLATFFSFGTPGFAIAFGVGFGYLYLARYADNPAPLGKAVRLGTIVVAVGVLIIGALQLAISEGITYANFFVHFYGALTFYLVALPTMPLWFRLLSAISERNRILAAVGLSVVCHTLGPITPFILSPEEHDGFLRLALLIVVAKYDYFTMVGGVLMGVAAGYFVRLRGDEPEVRPRLMFAGVIAIAAALVAAFILGEAGYLLRWPSPLTVWKWAFYFGVVLLLMAALLGLRDAYRDLSPWIRRPLETAAAVGQLALPFYVFHEAMFPLTQLLRQWQLVPGEGATLVTLALFAVGSWVMVTRTLRFFRSD